MKLTMTVKSYIAVAFLLGVVMAFLLVVAWAGVLLEQAEGRVYVH